MESRFDTELSQFLSSYNVDNSAAPIFEQTVGLLAGIDSPLDEGNHGIENQEFYMNMRGLDEENAGIILAYLQELCGEAGVKIIPGDIESQDLDTYQFRISESDAYHRLLPAFIEIFDLLAKETPDFLELFQEEADKVLDEISEYLANHVQVSEIVHEVINVINNLTREMVLLINEDRNKMIQMQDNLKKIVSSYQQSIARDETLQNEKSSILHGHGAARRQDRSLSSMSIFATRPIEISANINITTNIIDNLDSEDSSNENSTDYDSEKENVIEYVSLSSSDAEESSDNESYYGSDSSQIATPTNSPRL